MHRNKTITPEGNQVAKAKPVVSFKNVLYGIFKSPISEAEVRQANARAENAHNEHVKSSREAAEQSAQVEEALRLSAEARSRSHVGESDKVARPQ